MEILTITSCLPSKSPTRPLALNLVGCSSKPIISIFSTADEKTFPSSSSGILYRVVLMESVQYTALSVTSTSFMTISSPKMISPNNRPLVPAKTFTPCSQRGPVKPSECPVAAYELQGGQFKDWKNPFSEDKGRKPAKVEEKNIASWRKIYADKNSSYITDGNGRRFWFHSDLNSLVPEKFLKGKFLLKE